MITLILFVLILGVIIFVHELGHFVMAKRAGIYVHEFALGMGPKIWSKKGKDGETTYSLRAIPIGGFCALAGEGGDIDDELPKDRLLQNKTIWQRFLTMVFGALNNFILAIIILLAIGFIWGAPNLDPVIDELPTNLPAYQAGLEVGDRIISINDNKTATIDDVMLYLTLSDPEGITKIVVEKEDGSEQIYNIKPELTEIDGQERYAFGVSLLKENQRGFFETIEYVVLQTGALFHQMFVTLGSLFTGGLSVSQLSGPVGIFSIVGDSAEGGLVNLLYLTALLSINVGFLNLLPFPAFDGGRILFLLIEKIKGSPIKSETENIIHNIGFFILMGLMIYITFNDIFRLF